MPENRWWPTSRSTAWSSRASRWRRPSCGSIRSGACHPLLGYVGEASQNDLDQKQFATLEAGATVGKDGVERTYDSFLGAPTARRRSRWTRPGGPKQFLEDVAPTPGSNLVLTIDSDLQKAAERRARRGHPDGAQSSRASRTPPAARWWRWTRAPGEILAMASYPDYDPSLWVGGMTATKYRRAEGAAAHQPLFDRAIDGLYPAGSTFKPFVAAAALNAGSSPPDTIFDCNGKFTVAEQTWKDWNPAATGRRQPAPGHRAVVRRLLLQRGQPDVPAAQPGAAGRGAAVRLRQDRPASTCPARPRAGCPTRLEGRTPARPPRTRSGRPGDEINLAIGQGDLLVTPLQMVVALSAIANGGHRLGAAPRAADHRCLEQHHPPVREREARSKLGISPRHPRAPSARACGRSPPTPRAPPTRPSGLPHRGGRQDRHRAEEARRTTTPCSWATRPPTATRPEIVVVAIIEQGGHGSSVAAPVVRRVWRRTSTPSPSGTIDRPSRPSRQRRWHHQLKVLQNARERRQPLGFSLGAYLRGMDWILLGGHAGSGRRTACFMLYSATHADTNISTPFYYVRSQAIGLGHRASSFLVMLSIVNYRWFARWQHVHLLAHPAAARRSPWSSARQRDGRGEPLDRAALLQAADLRAGQVAAHRVSGRRPRRGGGAAAPVPVRHPVRGATCWCHGARVPAARPGHRAGLRRHPGHHAGGLGHPPAPSGDPGGRGRLRWRPGAADPAQRLRRPPAQGLPVAAADRLPRPAEVTRPSAGYQLTQSKIAIGSGMFTGKGYLQGTQTHLNFLPAHHTDFIFAVIGEELGFVGAMLLLGLFAVIIWRAFRIARHVARTCTAP